jgi:hypothetical protein
MILPAGDSLTLARGHREGSNPGCLTRSSSASHPESPLPTRVRGQHSGASEGSKCSGTRTARQQTGTQRQHLRQSVDRRFTNSRAFGQPPRRVRLHTWLRARTVPGCFQKLPRRLFSHLFQPFERAAGCS